jgi:hypothetical protein
VFGHGESFKMLQTMLVIFAGASLFGLTGVLFRDEITSERWLRGQRATSANRRSATFR